MDENVQLANMTRAQMRELMKTLGIKGMSKAPADKMRTTIEEHRARAPLVLAPQEGLSDGEDNKKDDDPEDSKENFASTNAAVKRTTRSSKRAKPTGSAEEPSAALEKSQDAQDVAEAIVPVAESQAEMEAPVNGKSQNDSEVAAANEPATEPVAASYPLVNLDASEKAQEVGEVTESSEPASKSASSLYPSVELEPFNPSEPTTALLPTTGVQETSSTNSNPSKIEVGLLPADKVLGNAPRTKNLSTDSSAAEMAVAPPPVDEAQASVIDEMVDQIVSDQALDENCHRFTTPPPAQENAEIAPAAEPTTSPLLTDRPSVAEFLSEKNFSILVPIFAREDLNDWPTVRAVSVDTLRSLGVTAGTAIRFCLAVKTLFGQDTSDPYKSVNPGEVTFSISVDNVQSLMEELSSMSIAGASLKPALFARGISGLPRRPTSIESSLPPRKRVAAIPATKPGTPVIPKLSPITSTPRRLISGLTPKKTIPGAVPPSVPPATSKVTRVSRLRPAEDKPAPENKTAALVKLVSKPKPAPKSDAVPAIRETTTSRTRAAAAAAKAPVVPKAAAVPTKSVSRTTTRQAPSPASSSEPTNGVPTKTTSHTTTRQASKPKAP
ncbi:hypothetical protein HDU87_004435 [Geranomyces variabilis]|uniref:Uncharacterized protein n=1 Tax=Geranomyces variabilis TaxID=109894 RepID=A0AAD5XPX0_9FUNG|nr:hypothetical protein HDU87_004435 [Geranomyces variabilis]